MGWYASEDGLVHVPTRRDFLEQYAHFLKRVDTILDDVRDGWDITTARHVVHDDYLRLRNHPHASDCLFSEDYFSDELDHAHEQYCDSPKYLEDLAEKHQQRMQIAEQKERVADHAMWTAAALAGIGWSIELTRHYIAPGLEHIVTVENIKWFCGMGASTLCVAALMNYWDSKDCG